MKAPLTCSLLLCLIAGSAYADWRHEKEKPYRVDERRDYMQRSVQEVQGDANTVVGKLRRFWEKLNVTPARLALGLGILGLFITLNRNKRLVHWAVITGLSWILVAFGAAAMFFGWPAFN